MQLTNHFQNAYVTRDIERSIALLRAQFGIAEFGTFSFDQDVMTPDGSHRLKLEAAIGWLDSIQIELIQPVSGYIDHYVASLPDEDVAGAMSFHHIAVRRDDIDQMRAEIAASGLPVFYESVEPLVTFMYVDARKTLGHFVEFVYSSPEGWELMQWPVSRSVIKVA